MSNAESIQPDTDAVQRQIDALRVNGPWAHDIVDLAKGELHSEVLNAPLTAEARSRKLAGLGHLFGGAIFGGPTYRLSARHPFQATPLARLTPIHLDTYSTISEEIGWSQARVPSGLGRMHFHFAEPPPGKCMATISLLALPHDGATGHVTLTAHGSTISIPITKPVNRSIDLIFTPPAGGPADVTMTIEVGVQILAFFFMTLGPAPLVSTQD
jgi:hypothetical protein